MTFFSKLTALLTAASVSSALPASPWGAFHPVSPVTFRAADNNTLAMGWYASWHEDYAPLADISWNKYTHMAFASV